MKKLMIIAALGFIANHASAQKVKESEVPASVKAGFTKQYPGLSAKWEKEGANYEAEFEQKKEEMSVLISPAGTILETETEITVSALPKGVSEYVAKNLAGKKIKEASKIIDNKGVITYEAEVNKEDYIFDSNGNFIKKNAK